jgi:type VI secretion system secreted protein VgrG
MPQFVNVSIDIEGTSVEQFSSLSLTQSIFDHHAFRLVCPTEAIDGHSGDVLHSSKNMMGATITIRVDAVGTKGQLKFQGVVSQVEAARHSGHAGDVIISGSSPTIILDNGPHCQSWEKQTIKDIAQEVMTHFPQNMLNPNIAPNYSEPLAYAVQYRESAWQFLYRLASTFGEWLFYDGRGLVLGPPQGAKVSLVYGSDLQNFNLSVQVRPADFVLMAYNYNNYEVFSGSPEGIADKAGLNDMGKLALQKSQKFYGAKPTEWNNQFLTSKKQLDDIVNTRASMRSSNLVRFTGSSGNPGVGLCGTVSVQGTNVYNGNNEAIGDYTVIAVHHQCDGQGNYSNNFTSIPASVKMPPVERRPETFCETQSAEVTDNNDPKGLGRIRVKFHWMGDADKSPWLRIASPHGGDSKGMFFIPEVGEEVIVAFEGDSPTKPYVIGMVYHGKAKTSFGNSGNDIKVLQTRSGNTITFDDSKGSVHVADAKGNDILIDGSGNINITASEKIVLTCGKAEISMKKNGDILISGKQVNILADDKASMMSSQASVVVDGTQNEVDVAGMKVSLEGQQEVDIKGLQTSISADTKVDIDGNAEVNIQSSAMVAVKGAMITLN